MTQKQETAEHIKSHTSSASLITLLSHQKEPQSPFLRSSHPQGPNAVCNSRITASRRGKTVLHNGRALRQSSPPTSWPLNCPLLLLVLSITELVPPERNDASRIDHSKVIHTYKPNYILNSLDEASLVLCCARRDDNPLHFHHVTPRITIKH